MLPLLREKLIEVLLAVGPLVAVVCFLLVALVDAPAALIAQFLVGAACVVAGMVLLFAGLDLGILPMGRFVGAELPKRGSVTLILAVAFAICFATTLAEPDVLVLARSVGRASDGAVREHAVLYVIALGLAIFAAMAMARVVYGFSMPTLLSAAYGAMLVVSYFTPPEFVAMAYDSGGRKTQQSEPVRDRRTSGQHRAQADRQRDHHGSGEDARGHAGRMIEDMTVRGFGEKT